jgi:hypothetical protein
MGWRTLLLVDPNTPIGRIRAIHGVNNGPKQADMFQDLSSHFKAAAFPDARLHDPHYPVRDVVDISAVFPDFSRDPSDPNSYDFLRTDEYLQAIANVGATVTYRLGYSIDHHLARRYAQPPKDIAKWAQICAGIVKHYSMGWAGGLPKLVHRWEIWNEPDQRPWEKSPCFVGPWDLFFRTYEAAAKAIKALDPSLVVGGPGMTQLGTEDGFLTAFLKHQRQTNAPLDFLTWHIYAANPDEVVNLSRKVRSQLDEVGYTKVPTLLTEWHYFPGNEPWEVISNTTPGNGDHQGRSYLHALMNGSRSATFTAATLIKLQDESVEMAHFYLAEPLFYFGLFDSLGAPLPPYDAMLLFSKLMRTPVRLKITTTDENPSLVWLAGGSEDGKTINVLVANHSDVYQRVHISHGQPGKWTYANPATVVGMGTRPEPFDMPDGKAPLPPWTVTLITMQRQD